MMSLLRASNFCRVVDDEKRSFKVQASWTNRLDILPSSEIKGEAESLDPWICASRESLAAVALMQGGLAILENDHFSQVVRIRLENGSPSEDSKRDDELPAVQVSCAVALSLAIAWEGVSKKSHAASTECVLSALSNNSSSNYSPASEQLEPAAHVVLGCLGWPITSRDFEKSPSDLIWPFPTSGRLVQVSTIILVRDGDSMFFYQILEVRPSKRASLSFGEENVVAYRTTNTTQYTLTASKPPFWHCRRLPPFHHRGVAGYPKPFPQSLLNQRDSKHPDLQILIDSLFHIAHDSNPRERVVRVVGTEHGSDVRRLVQSASSEVGMRCMHVMGLAAFANVVGNAVSTGSISDKLTGLNAAMERAYSHAPCVLHLCDFDSELEDDRHGGGNDAERLWSTLVHWLTPDVVQRQGKTMRNKSLAPAVLVVLSSQEHLKATCIISKEVPLPPVVLSLPNKNHAQVIWHEDINEDSVSLVPFLAVEQSLEGRPVSDLLFLKEQCTLHEQKISENEIEEMCNELDNERRGRNTSVAQIARVTWEDVGGLDQVRREILDAVELPLRHPHLFPNFGRSGILLYGPPGTGKTLVAKAVATECKLPFLSVKGPELLGSYVGESEANVREVFANTRAAANQNSPAACVLFFDELDSLAPRRDASGSGGGVMDRVVATLAAELDKEDDSCFVFVLGATNRPDLLDPSLLRPGRFDRLVFLGVAKAHEERARILSSQIRRLRLEGNKSPDEVAQLVVHRISADFTGADFSAVASGALLLATERLCRQAEQETLQLHGKSSSANVEKVLSEWEDDRLNPIVTVQDFLDAAKDVIPSVSEADLQRYSGLREQFSS